MPNEKPDAASRLRGASERRRLAEAFAPWRVSVHRHLVFRSALDGLTYGAVAGTGFAAAAWASHHHPWRVGGVALAALGAVIGGVRGAQRAWTDDQIALYVDGVLGTPESVTSAISLGADAPPAVIDAAIEALEGGPRRAPGRVRRMHSLALVGTIACIAVLAVRAPKPAHADAPPGTDIVKLTEVPGLDKVAEVDKLPAKDAEQKEKLQKIAEEARELKKKLLEGMPRREALDRLNKLKQKLEAEKLGANQNKAGLDAAANALKSNGFPGLADALEDRDLQSFDEMMERIANAREDEDRAKAKEALEKAIEEAKKKGGGDVAKALEKQKEKLDARKDKSDVLKELADALKGTPADPGASGKNYQDKATDQAGKELSDALRKGLEKLTPEERKKLADKLREQAEKGGSNGKMSPNAKKKLKDLADKLKTPEGQKELDKQLKDLANENGGGSDDEDREKGLDDADDGADDTGKELGDQNDGKPGKNSNGKNGNDGKNGKHGKSDGKDGNGSGEDKDGNGSGEDKDGNGNGGNGGGPGIDLPGGEPGGQSGGGDGGDHKGKTKKLDAESLKAKAKGLGMKGTPKPTGGKVTTPGQDGATSTVKSTGDLSGTTADEVNGVDKADVPEAVRRQVKAYFE